MFSEDMNCREKKCCAWQAHNYFAEFIASSESACAEDREGNSFGYDLN